MAAFCHSCGQELKPSTAAYCGACGTSQPANFPDTQAQSRHLSSSGKQSPVTSQPPSGPPQSKLAAAWASGGDQVQCPGCQKTAGNPGALCPACGSRYPSMRTAMVGAGLFVFGAFLLLLDWIIHGEFFYTPPGKQQNWLLWGVIIAVLGIVVTGFGLGRVGPERQQACCGCTCALALIVLPVGAYGLFLVGGPELALLAVPAWVPVVRFLDWLGMKIPFVRTRARLAARTIESGRDRVLLTPDAAP